MDVNPYSFPECTIINIISSIKESFTIKKPKIGINKILKNVKVIKEDGNNYSFFTSINNPNKLHAEHNFMKYEEDCLINELNEDLVKNENNMLLYKSCPPKNKLIYTDNQMDEEEMKLLNNPIYYDFLLCVLQQDPSNFDSMIDSNLGKFVEPNEYNDYNNITNKNFNKCMDAPNIKFDSLFEEGNLRMAIKLESDTENEFDLIMRKDYNNEKNYSWFYFSVTSDKEVTIKLNILNFTKKKILFGDENNIRILTYNQKDKWQRNTFNIKYYQNNINIYSPGMEPIGKDKGGDKEDLPEINFFSTLSFCYRITKENINTPIYFSYCYPYSYTTLQEYLYNLSIRKINKNKLRFSTLEKTIFGNPLDILYITNFSSPLSEINTRQSIIFTGRVHPGETSSSYVMEGVINTLLNNSISSNELLNKYIFKIVPMLNPDGVIIGHYRNNIFGKDLNRMWQDPRVNTTPTIYYTKKLIAMNKPLFFCDFHGHSTLFNSALYCCSPKKKKKGVNIPFSNTSVKSYHIYEEKVFMKIFEDQTKFYEKTGEKYTVSKSKMKSARGVLYYDLSIFFTYALETSLISFYDKSIINNIKNLNSLNEDGYNNLPSNLKPTNIKDYNQIGIDFINSLAKWDNKNYFYGILKKIREDEEGKKTSSKDVKENPKEIKDNTIKSNMDSCKEIISKKDRNLKILKTMRIQKELSNRKEKVKMDSIEEEKSLKDIITEVDEIKKIRCKSKKNKTNSLILDDISCLNYSKEKKSIVTLTDIYGYKEGNLILNGINTRLTNNLSKNNVLSKSMEKIKITSFKNKK